MEIFFLIFFLGLLFDYTNGFHDAANVVSTVIATKVLKPFVAIGMACIFNTIGAFQVGPVAETIASGVVKAETVNPYLIIAALCGAIFWNLLTWYFGIPSSSSYALVGGLIGSAMVHFKEGMILWSTLFSKIVLPMVISPFIGTVVAFLGMKLAHSIRRYYSLSADHSLFGYLQVGSAALVALSHGINDAQKSMGIISLGLFSAKVIPSLYVPYWVVISCAIVIGLGTASGGFKIIRTMGFQITKLKPVQGCVTETSASLVILLSSFFGFPISSTHMIVGGITGVGLSQKGRKGVEWGTVRKVVWAWIFTLPGSAVCSYILYRFALLV